MKILKKITHWIITSVYILLLMIMSVYLFWEICAKDHIEQYIKKEYGYAIMETYNNTELIKNFKIPENDKGEN